MTRRLALVATGAVPAAFLVVFFWWPLTAILGRGLEAGGLTSVVTDPGVGQVVWFTTWQATASTLLTLAVGLPVAWLFARVDFRGRSVVRALVTVPFVLPTLVVATAFQSLFERLGLDSPPVDLSTSVWAILSAHVFFNVAVVARTVGAAWSVLDPRLEDAARTLGASPARTFVTVTARRLRPAILASALITFLFSFTSFGVILILGGPFRATIETEIYRYAIVRTDLVTASALALVQLVCVLALVVVSTIVGRRVAVPERVRREVETAAPSTPARRRAALAIIAGLVVLQALPLLVLVERSLRSGDGFGLANYRALADPSGVVPVTSLEALGNSLTFALAAAAIAGGVGALASWVVARPSGLVPRLFDAAFLVPLGTSAVTLGFGMIITLDDPPLDLRSSAIIIPIAHAVVGLPFVLRTTVPAIRSLDERLRDAAATLGASPLSIRFRVDLPIVGRALATGTAFAFAVSLGEFGATAFLARRPDQITAPQAVFRLLGQPGEALQGEAAALCVVLMAATVAVVTLIDRSPGRVTAL